MNLDAFWSIYQDGGLIVFPFVLTRRLANRVTTLKARLHRRFLSRQLELQLQNRTCKPGAIFSAICRRDIAGVSNMFETWCNFSATKIASICRDKNRLCKRALKHGNSLRDTFHEYLLFLCRQGVWRELTPIVLWCAQHTELKANTFVDVQPTFTGRVYFWGDRHVHEWYQMNTCLLSGLMHM